MIHEERIQIGEIPAMQIYGDDAPKGVVVFYHGWTSKKEFQGMRGRIFAAYGYDVLVPEAINHGERGVIDYDEPAAYVDFWQTIFQNVAEAPQIIAYAQKWRPNKPLAVTGHSMGGFSTMGIMTRYKEFKTAVAMNGSGWWDESERRFRAALKLDKPEVAACMWEKIRELDPYTHVDQLSGRSLLALNGGADPTVDNAAQTMYMEKLAAHQDVKSRFVTFPGLGHFVTTQMMGEAVDWLDKVMI